jgi:hypothetical protein
MNIKRWSFLILIFASISVAAQVNAPVGNLSSCTAQGPAPVEWTTIGTPVCYVSLFTKNNTITLNARAQCVGNGTTVEGDQYAYALQCQNLYELYIDAATENDTFTEDGCTFNTIGNVTVTSQLILGAVTIMTTYAGEECPYATPFESDPGVFAEGPDC